MSSEVSEFVQVRDVKLFFGLRFGGVVGRAYQVLV